MLHRPAPEGPSSSAFGLGQPVNLAPMRIAVLSFNATDGTRESIARQMANYAAEIANGASEAEIGTMIPMRQEMVDGVPQVHLVTPGNALNEPSFVKEFMAQGQFDIFVDGLLDENRAGGGKLTVRFFKDNPDSPAESQDFGYLAGGEFEVIRGLIGMLLAHGGGKLPDGAEEDENLFGTSNSQAFLKFLEGYDVLQYIERAQGMVGPDFDPQPAMESLNEAIEGDKDWEAPFLVLTQLCRMCVQYRIGNAQMVEAALEGLTKSEPEDPRGWFALGEFYANLGNHEKASETMEKAAQLDPNEPAFLHRLAMSQLALGMPVNAERNLRKAAELENGEDLPSLELLSNVLTQTGRPHEVPELWHDVVRQNPQSGRAHARYAISLFQANRREDGIKAFEDALTTVEENAWVKRYYAPVLSEEGDVDRAMDFYEDCIDMAPADVPLLLEYARTLDKANRQFEIPEVLKNVLKANPDQNTAAQTQAWLLELEQPKRAEVVRAASEKAEQGDFDGAIKDLKPLTNWLGDYWKLWMVLATAYNQTGEHTEAESAARRILEMFPSCEPAYVELNNALGGQGKNEEAYALMQIALGNLPQSLPVALSTAVAAKRVGREEEARNLAQQIRQVAGEQEGLSEILAEIEK